MQLMYNGIVQCNGTMGLGAGHAVDSHFLVRGSKAQRADALLRRLLIL